MSTQPGWVCCWGNHLWGASIGNNLPDYPNGPIELTSACEDCAEHDDDAQRQAQVDAGEGPRRSALLALVLVECSHRPILSPDHHVASCGDSSGEDAEAEQTQRTDELFRYHARHPLTAAARLVALI